MYDYVYRKSYVVYRCVALIHRGHNSRVLFALKANNGQTLIKENYWTSLYIYDKLTDVTN